LRAADRPRRGNQATCPRRSRSRGHETELCGHGLDAQLHQEREVFRGQEALYLGDDLRLRLLGARPVGGLNRREEGLDRCAASPSPSARRGRRGQCGRPRRSGSARATSRCSRATLGGSRRRGSSACGRRSGRRGKPSFPRTRPLPEERGRAGAPAWCCPRLERDLDQQDGAAARWARDLQPDRVTRRRAAGKLFLLIPARAAARP
jgi:hypothetical protein